MKTHVLFVSLLLLLLAACGPRPGGTPTLLATDEAPQFDAGEMEAPPPELAAVVVSDVASEQGLLPEDVAFLICEPAEWSDAGLGCPGTGTVYAQVITPGYRILVEAGGIKYEVHTDEMGESVVLCNQAPLDLTDPEDAFLALLAYLVREAPGFGLSQQGIWVQEDVTPADLVGSSTRLWLSREWSLEMSFPIVPSPVYEAILSHNEAGVVWAGALEEDGQVSPAEEPVPISFAMELSDESVSRDEWDGWKGVEVAVRDGTVHFEQNLVYPCRAELALTAGRDGAVVKVMEANIGGVSRRTCLYLVTADLPGLPPGSYTVEVWGVQYFDMYPLEMLGSAEVLVP